MVWKSNFDVDYGEVLKVHRPPAPLATSSGSLVSGSVGMSRALKLLGGRGEWQIILWHLLHFVSNLECTNDVRTTGCEVLCSLVGGVFAWLRLLMVEKREDLSHARALGRGPDGEFLEGVGPEPQLGRMGKAQPCCFHFPFFFLKTMERKFLSHKPFLVSLSVKGHLVFLN